MSRLAKTGWALAVFIFLVLGMSVYSYDGMGGMKSYVLGVIFGVQWAWILKGVK